MADIQLLDINTANQIAAGEVVERPASVVKELVENALDAGAAQIEVTVFAGGTEYIRVADNGCGMSEANARLAVLRHATSKIVRAEDLLSLHTLGFRGEALPSIASVSNFKLLTRPAEAEFATSVSIDGGENMEVSGTGGSAGTTVVVENLFFNVPARRKFLKQPATEGRYISELLTRLALSRPDVSFKLVNNDKEVLHTPGDGDLLGTVRALYGRNVSRELLTVSFESPEIKVSGYIGRPTLLKGTRQWQTLFVNGRSIVNKMLAKAIDHAYQSQIPKSGFPFAVLNVEVDTASVDVNVHPQKSEIKFSDDSLVYRAVYRALTDALTRPMSAQKAEMKLLPDSELNAFVQQPPAPAYAGAAQPQQPIRAAAAEKAPLPATCAPGPERTALFEPVFRSAAAEPVFKTPEYGGRQEALTGVHETREQFAAAPAAAPAAEKESAADRAERAEIVFTDTDSGVASVWPIGQIDKTFIVAQSEDTLYLIDQHAAHERILYDKLAAAHEQVPSQQLLMPLFVDMAAEDIARIEEHREEFLRLGVDAEAGGENMLRISSLPADIKAGDAEEFIYEISRMLSELRSVSGSDLRQSVLHMTACRAAIKAGQLLNMRQMRQLIIDLLNTEHPFTCPHGRPCMIAIDSRELYKMFKRTGF